MGKLICLAAFISLSVASPEASPSALASPDAYASNYGYYGDVASPPSSQFHAQDDVGQYNYGFSSPDQTKSEIKTADGVTRGAYSYVDANGIVQTVQYISDALGFRVAATNLPVHPVDSNVQPEAVAVAPQPVAVTHQAVAVAPQAVAVTHQAVAAAPQSVAVAPQAVAVAPQSVVATPQVGSSYISPSVEYAYLPYAQGYNYYVQPTQYQVASYASPAPVVQPAPVVEPVPVVAGTQYHQQDEAGQYTFGYNDPNSVRQEVKTADGVVRGAYRYVDNDGKVQTVEYIADSAGFRVAASNLPQGTQALPLPVQDTPEVAAAKIAHAEAYAQADAAAAVEPEPAAYAGLPVLADLTALPVAVQDTPEVAAAKIAHAEAFAQAEQAAAIQPDVPIAPVQAPIETVPYVAPTVSTPAVAATPVVQTPLVAGADSQYHSQDDLGQYTYGYSDPNSIKQEVKTADGVTRGAYSYVDANGIVQTVNYIADALGFRVGATNLPVHVVDSPVETVQSVEQAPVVVAQAAPAAPLPVATAQASPVIAPQVNYAYLPYASNYAYSTPVDATQAVAASPSVDGANSQFHAQDDLGQYNYGFSNPTQTKQEVRTADGVTRGGYQYIDANGLVQTVNYISDAMGFRVAATNLPVAPAAAVETVEEPAITAAYTSNGVIAPQVQYSYLPYAQGYAYNSVPATVATEVKAAPSRPVQSVTPAYYGAAVAPAVSNSVAQPAVYTTTPVLQAQPAAPVVQAPAPVVQASTPVVQAASPVVAVASDGSQYHAQDDFGQYSFGYSDGNSIKQEIKTADGVIRGAYSYVDSDGIVQNVNYIADALGFRVGATNLPVHNVDDVVQAPVESVPVAAKTDSSVLAPQVAYAYLPYASNYGYATQPTVVTNSVPVQTAQYVAPVAEAPVAAAAAAPVVPVGAPDSQYHAQDELGQYTYGYQDPNSIKQEIKSADGVTRGSYSYLDANGLVQTVNYISDAMGFRVAATNLPVHNVEEEAKEEAIVTPQVAYSYLPYAQNYGYGVATAGAA